MQVQLLWQERHQFFQYQSNHGGWVHSVISSVLITKDDKNTKIYNIEVTSCEPFVIQSLALK